MSNVEVESINLDIDDWEDAPEDKEKLAESKKELGNQQYKLKRYSNALTFYTEAIELCPNNPSYYGNRSACYIMLANRALALEDAKKAVKINPKFVKGWIRVAKCYLAIGDLQQAENALAKVAEIEPQNPTFLKELKNLEVVSRFDEEGKKAFEKEDFRKVVFCMERAMEAGGACVRFKLMKAECLARLGRLQEAQDIANEIISTDKSNIDAILVRALCLYYEDNIDKAFQHFQHILKLAPDHAKAQAIYKKAKSLKVKKEEGNAAYHSGKFADAIKIYSEALEIDPCNTKTNSKLFFNRASALTKLDRMEDAVNDCTSALELDPSYLKALLRRANCYMQLKNFDAAVIDYEAAYKKDKSCRAELQEAKLEQKKALRKDYYKILGVEKCATTDDIKRAYRKRALIHHPDRHANATEDEKKEQEKMFKELGEAYTVLSDPTKRRRYDNGQDFEEFGSYGNFNPDEIFQTFFPDGGQQFFMHSYAPGGHTFSFTFQ